MATTHTDFESAAAREAAAERTVRSRTYLLIGALIGVFAYLTYAWYAFDVSGILAKSRPQQAAIFAKDAVAHKVHVTKLMRRDEIDITIENEATARFTEPPAWVELRGESDVAVNLGDGVVAAIEGNVVTFTVPDYGDVIVVSQRPQIEITLPPGPAPDWISIAEKRVDARIDWDKRVQVTASKIEIHRFFYGWENFFFDFGSPLQMKSTGELIGLMFSGDRIDPEQSNASLIFNSIWNNKEWRHGYVFRSLFETILMAFLGTFFAAVIGLPLAFLAAKNFTPSLAVRFGLRRLFDFLRGIDMLIWSLIFIRAFGLGPLTGALAIAFTDTGTLGKLFSEALENVDNKQIEGVRATGASQLQRYRFGVIPQIMPVFISQSLYYLESNTRSATVIGALGAGGIGLVLVETMNTQRDWENVLYLIILTIVVVVLMDTISSWLRRRLIEGKTER